MNYKYDLGWGNPYCLLEILSNLYRPRLLGTKITDLIYEEDEGNEELIQYCKQITKQETGIDYKHVLITNGATQALNSIIRAWSKTNATIESVITSELGYPFYPTMIDKASLKQIKVDFHKPFKAEKYSSIIMVDSPSNPLGYQFTVDKTDNFIIWDGVYHNKIYNANTFIQPKHDVFVGSFSKLLGLSGARVGWLATNNKNFFDLFKTDSLYENATVSKVSQDLVLDILNNINLNYFMSYGMNSLDLNREELQKLSYLTGSDVQKIGMFYCAEIDDKLFDLFDRAGIQYVVFNRKNGNKMIRLNIAQTNEIIKKAVDSILKIDRR